MSNQETYQAAEVSDGVLSRFRIHYSDSEGVTEVACYAYLKSVVHFYKAPELLMLVFPARLVLLEGKNLHILLNDFQEEQVRALYPFDPARHKEPEAGAPVIHSITWEAAPELRNIF